MSRRAKKRLERNLKVIQAQDALGCHHDKSHGALPEEETCCDIFHVDMRFGGVDVSEVFSVPRLCPMANKKGLKGGRSYDVQDGWNFLDPSHRKQCLHEVRTVKPRHVHVCPPCGPYSSLQNINRNRVDEKEARRKRVEADVLLHFAIQICGAIEGGSRV